MQQLQQATMLVLLLVCSLGTAELPWGTCEVTWHLRWHLLHLLLQLPAPPAGSLLRALQWLLCLACQLHQPPLPLPQLLLLLLQVASAPPAAPLLPPLPQLLPCHSQPAQLHCHQLTLQTASATGQLCPRCC
jgi:hypothetical protein